MYSSSLEGRLKLFRFYKANETVSGHEEVDALLCVKEAVVIWSFHVLYDLSSCLMVNVDL